MSTETTYMPPIEVIRALRSIALTIADEYAAKLATLPPDAKTERRACLIQREMATLYGRACLPWREGAPIHQILAFMERRWRNVATTNAPELLAHYEAATEDARRVMLPYLLGHTFCVSQFLRPWRQELAKAEEAEDIAAVFELKLKLGTVSHVIEAQADWWRANADRLPTIPAPGGLSHG